MRSVRGLLAALALLAGASAALADPEGCGICHGAERVQLEKSVHRSAAFGCTTCHGGDPDAVDSKDGAHAAARGYRGKLARTDIAAACGTCHADVARMRPFGLRTDPLAAWATSSHGRSMREKGITDSATCTDCHGVHEVHAVKDPRSPAARTNVPATCARCHDDAALMKRHGIETHAVADYAGSIHGTALERGEPGVPSCADCHDAHAAAPPGATEVADVCGNCHREMRDLFLESPHAAASKRGAMHQCVTCHGNHAIADTGPEAFDAPSDGDDRGGVRCLSCHDASKGDDRGALTALAFGAGLREAESLLRDARVRVEAVAAQGFHVEAERETLERARRELLLTVPLTHTANLVRVEGALRRARSLVDEALGNAETRIRQSRDRRIFGSAAGVVLLVCAAILLLRRVRHAS